MSIAMIARKALKYRTRHLKAGDNFRVKNDREARVLTHLGKAEREANENFRVALDDAREKVGLENLSKDTDEIKVVRDEYEAVFGKRPFNGWSIDTLRMKIADAS